MKVINVIFLRNGLIEELHSYILEEGEDNSSPKALEATKRFTEYVKSIVKGIQANDISYAVEMGSHQVNSKEVLLRWSTSVEYNKQQ